MESQWFDVLCAARNKYLPTVALFFKEPRSLVIDFQRKKLVLRLCGKDHDLFDADEYATLKEWEIVKRIRVCSDV